MTFADRTLAQRLESLEVRLSSDFARARRASQPEADTVILEVAGGCALYLGTDSPLTEAKGLGMVGPVSLADLESMERVFHDRGVAAKVMVCPLADPSLIAGLAARGYRASGFEDVLYRELNRSEVALSTPPGIEIAWAKPDEATVYGRVLARGFAAPEEPGPGLLSLVTSSAEVPGMINLLAWSDGEAVGAAGLLIDGDLAMLCGASTLPDFRNQGIQTAMAQIRLAHAAEAGCGLVVIGAEPGSASHRNAERLGFRVAYTKVVLTRDPS